MNVKQLIDLLHKFDPLMEVANEIEVLEVEYENPLFKDENKKFFTKWKDLKEVNNEYQADCDKMLELLKPLYKKVIQIN